MTTSLSTRARLAVLLAAIGGLLFDGVELGLMPVASLSVSQDLLGADYTPTLGGDWFARFTAALMLGAAVGGILLGNLGDVVGRTRALGISILVLFGVRRPGGARPDPGADAGAAVPGGAGRGRRVAQRRGAGGRVLAGQVPPDRGRLMGAATQRRHSDALPDRPRLAHHARFVALDLLPGSGPGRARRAGAAVAAGIAAVAGQPRRRAQAGRADPRAVSSAAAAADAHRDRARLDSHGRRVGGQQVDDSLGGQGRRRSSAGYKGVTQGWWALGAVLGSFFGAQIAAWLGRRRAYAVISLGATVLTLTMFLGTAPLRASFLPMVFAQGFVATLFFGWLPLYLPELFPTRVRAAGSGIAYNVGRFATAVGVLAPARCSPPSEARIPRSARPAD